MLTNPKVSTALNLLQQGGTEIMKGNLLYIASWRWPALRSADLRSGFLRHTVPSPPVCADTLRRQRGLRAYRPSESLDQVFGGDSGVRAGDANVVGKKEAPIPARLPLRTASLRRPTRLQLRHQRLPRRRRQRPASAPSAEAG